MLPGLGGGGSGHHGKCPGQDLYKKWLGGRLTESGLYMRQENWKHKTIVPALFWKHVHEFV